MEPSHIVVAPDSFKESIGAAQAAHAIARGWLHERPNDHVELCPIADGGEGTLDAIATARPDGRRLPVEVMGPDGEMHTAEWLLLPDFQNGPGRGTGVVELASTSGLELLAGRRRPWTASTRGFGTAIRAALDAGVARLVLGIGGSASSDGGAGMLAELGALLTDGGGRTVADGAEGLLNVAHVDLSGLRPNPPGGVRVLTDVVNPLLGERGAVRIFGTQKGFGADDMRLAEEALERWADHVTADLCSPGAGAAGGTGFALLAWGAELVSGADEIRRLSGIETKMATADLVITGEGSFDHQSAAGKGPHGVLVAAAARGIPSAVIAGRIKPGVDLAGARDACALEDIAGSPRRAIDEAPRWLEVAAKELAQTFTRRSGERDR